MPITHRSAIYARCVFGSVWAYIVGGVSPKNIRNLKKKQGEKCILFSTAVVCCPGVYDGYSVQLLLNRQVLVRQHCRGQGTGSTGSIGRSSRRSSSSTSSLPFLPFLLLFLLLFIPFTIRLLQPCKQVAKIARLMSA